MAARVLRAFASDRGNEWARSLETTLWTMTQETCYKAAQSLKPTLITSYFVNSLL